MSLAQRIETALKLVDFAPHVIDVALHVVL
jgi:hypothetical protein